jgi:hypothetical protein
MVSARLASAMHLYRTGKTLRIQLDRVQNGEPYPEMLSVHGQNQTQEHSNRIGYNVTQETSKPKLKKFYRQMTSQDSKLNQVMHWKLPNKSL